MAIALTPFEGMNGFRPLTELSQHCTLFPELAAILGEAVVQQLRAAAEAVAVQSSADEQQQQQQAQAQTRAALQGVMHAIMFAEEATVAEQLSLLVARLPGLAAAAAAGPIVSDYNPFVLDVMQRLHADFPGDSGLVFPLVLNTIAMQPGQAMYLAANEPHAYISGDIVECMALSDNVVRAGLTPKFRDRETLEKMLTYKCAPVAYCHAQALDACTQLYRPPTEGFPEFEVECVSVPAGTSHSVAVHDCASILIVTEYQGGVGEGATFTHLDAGAGAEKAEPCPQAGACFLQRAGHALRIDTAAGAGLTLYRAHINLGN